MKLYNSNNLKYLLEKLKLQIYKDPSKARLIICSHFKNALYQNNQLETFLLWPLVIKSIYFSGNKFEELDGYINWIEKNGNLKSIKVTKDLEFDLKSSYYLALMIRRPESKTLRILKLELWDLLLHYKPEDLPIGGEKLLGNLFLKRAFYLGNKRNYIFSCGGLITK